MYIHGVAVLLSYDSWEHLLSHTKTGSGVQEEAMESLLQLENQLNALDGTAKFMEGGFRYSNKVYTYLHMHSIYIDVYIFSLLGLEIYIFNMYIYIYIYIYYFLSISLPFYEL